MNKRCKKNSGQSIVELLIAITIFLIIVGGMFASYLLIQRSWIVSKKQLRIQSQGWQVLKQINQEIMAANEAVYTIDDEGDDDKNGIILSRPANESGMIVKYHFWYDSGNQTILHNISYGEEELNEDNEIVLVDQVIIEEDEYLFNISDRIITVDFKIRDARTDDGYQGFDLHTKVNLRNQ